MLPPQIIDAGSSGSRMHVYEWEPRMFKTLPPPISIPGSTNHWTQRMEPGISDYSTHPEVSFKTNQLMNINALNPQASKACMGLDVYRPPFQIFHHRRSGSLPLLLLLEQLPLTPETKMAACRTSTRPSNPS